MTVTMEVMPRFPARVDGGPGIAVSHANGVYTIESDTESLVPLSPVPDPANVWVMVWNEALDFYQRVKLQDISYALGGGITEIVQDTSPQLGGNLDLNGHSVIYSDDTGILDTNGNRLIWTQTTPAASSYLEATNAAGSDPPQWRAAGTNASIDLAVGGKGTGGLITTFTPLGATWWDVDRSHRWTLTNDSNLTVDRTLTIRTGDADRIIDVSAGNFAPSAYGLDLIDSPNATAAQATLALVPGTNVQPQNAILTSLAGLSVAAGDVFYGTAGGVLTRLPAGADGYYLRTHGTSTPPDWASPPTGGTITGAALSVLGRSVNSSGPDADIVATAGSNYVLRENGGVLQFGPVPTTGALTGAALSILGRAVNSSGPLADIATTSGSGAFLQESGGALVWAAPPAPTIANGSITYAKIQNVATDRLLGRDTAGSGVVEEITVGGGLEFTGTTGIRRSAYTGDVTAAAGVTVLTIANDAVSNPKLANMTNGTVKARGTASTGDPEDIAIGNGLILDATSLRLDVGKQSIWLPAESWISNTTGGPSAGSAEMATNKNMVVSKDFDAAAIESVQKNIVLPKSWDKGTVSYQVYWSHAATTVNFGVMWGLAGYAISSGDGLDQVFPANVTVTSTGGATNTLYVSTEATAVTIGGSPVTADLINLRLQRVATNAADTLAVDARLAGVMLFYRITTLKDD